MAARVEVLESAETTDANSVERLYRRIGFQVRTGVFETEAAGNAERQVYRDLVRCRP